MSQNSFKSKAFAGAFAVLSLSVIAGVITMTIFYNIAVDKEKPTPRPAVPSTTAGPPPVMRLPRNLAPSSYKIFLKPELYVKIIEEVNVTSPNQSMVFTGNSTVNFHCIQGTKTIYLNSKDLTVSNPVVMDQSTNKGIRVTGMKHHEDQSDFLEIQLADALVAGGNYSLFLAFKGDISENLDALYVSTYLQGHPAYEGDTDVER